MDILSSFFKTFWIDKFDPALEEYILSSFKELDLTINKLDLNRVIPKNKDYETQIEYVEDRPGHDKRYAIDSDLIQKELGWLPNKSFEESLEITVKWYIENQDWCEKLFLKSGYFGERVGLKK